MKLTFLGAAHEVTGSCTLLETAGKRILIDCGMEQGADIYENCDLPVSAGELAGEFSWEKLKKQDICLDAAGLGR